MRFPSKAPVLVLALTLSATASACGLGTDKVGHPPAAPSGLHRGGVLRVGITAPGGIDALNAYEPAGKLISTTMCDTVVAIDPVTGQLREALAKGWVNAGGNFLTIKLRHGVKFTDGKELTAHDVNASLQQLVASANGAYAAGLARQFVSTPAEAGKTDLLEDPSKAQDVATGLNKYDFQLTSLRLNGGALRAFAEPAMAPVSHAARDADPDAFARNPVCVGPYALAAPYRTGDKQIRLKRSKEYYGKNVGYTAGGIGYADEIDFTIYPSEIAALTAYQQGHVDVVQIPRSKVAGTRDTASLVYGPATAVEYIGLPGATSGPFSDSRVRLALSQAIDRTALVSSVFGPATQVATGFEPPALAITEGPSLEGRTTKSAPLATCGGGTPARPDLASARAQLAAATREPGAKPLTGFTLEVNDDAPYPALARALAAQWKAGLGLNVRVVTTPWNAYVAKSTSSTGFETPFRIRWTTDATAPTTTYNDEQSYLGSLFSGESTAGNWSRYSDRRFEFGLTADAAGLTEVAQRGLGFAELAGLLCRQLPLIPLVFERPAFLVRSTAVLPARKVPVSRNGVLLLRELSLK